MDIPLIAINQAARILTKALLDKGGLPAKAEIDALHIAIAATNNIDFLLTWNCTHIANAMARPKIEQIIHEAGFKPPIISTPEEL
jgi:hypothetical protein